MTTKIGARTKSSDELIVPLVLKCHIYLLFTGMYYVRSQLSMRSFKSNAPFEEMCRQVQFEVTWICV